MTSSARNKILQFVLFAFAGACLPLLAALAGRMSVPSPVESGVPLHNGKGDFVAIPKVLQKHLVASNVELFPDQMQRGWYRPTASEDTYILESSPYRFQLELGGGSPAIKSEEDDESFTLILQMDEFRLIVRGPSEKRGEMLKRLDRFFN
jgi:hypothetical protein